MWILRLFVSGAGNKVWVIRNIWGLPHSSLSSLTSLAPEWEAAGPGLSRPTWFPQPLLASITLCWLSTPTPLGSPQNPPDLCSHLLSSPLLGEVWILGL